MTNPTETNDWSVYMAFLITYEHGQEGGVTWAQTIEGGRWCFICCLSLIPQQVSFSQTFWATFLSIGYNCSNFTALKWLPNVVLKNCSLFLSTKQCHALTESGVLAKLHSGPVQSHCYEFYVNKSKYILNYVCIHRNMTTNIMNWLVKSSSLLLGICFACMGSWV